LHRCKLWNIHIPAQADLLWHCRLRASDSKFDTPRDATLIVGPLGMSDYKKRIPAALVGGVVDCRTRQTTPEEEMTAIGWQVWALLSAVFAALTAILAKVGVEEVDPDVATFIRTLVIVVVLGALLFLTRQKVGTIPPKSYLFLTFSNLATGASWLCYFRALKLGDAAQVAPLDKLSVVLVAIFAVIFLGERLTIRDAAGIALITMGAVLVATARA
jgi:transporter family protein